MFRYSLVIFALALGCGSMQNHMASPTDAEWAAKNDESKAKPVPTSNDQTDETTSESSSGSDEESPPPRTSSEGFGEPFKSPPPNVEGTVESRPPGPECVDSRGDTVECLTDKDCCKGFYCGIDPDGSPRIKVCLYGG